MTNSTHTDLGPLSKEERQLVEIHRAYENLNRIGKQQRVEFLEIAAGYEKWLQEKSAPDNFETFENFVGTQYPNSVIQGFKAVQRIRQAVIYGAPVPRAEALNQTASTYWYMQGVRAFDIDFDIDDCPSQDPAAVAQWNKGWRAAEQASAQPK